MASAPVTSCPTSVLRPMKRNATELATNAIICQNDLTDTRAFWTTVVCIVRFPKYSPATTTAIRPETPR